MITTTHFILYVSDQQRSAQFFEAVLAIPPRLNVPGMTEFELGANCVLGLMPWTSISRLFNRPAPNLTQDALQAEVYLLVDDPSRYHARALAAGAMEQSPLAPRDWGHLAAYSIDWDGHVIAFAAAIK